jgi:hypothetical protein
MGGVILTYGLAEAALGALAGYGVCRPVEKALGRAQTA